MNKIIEIYSILLKTYGKQGWWPLTIEGYKTRHHAGGPKNNKHRFEIIAGAILTQNTNWKNVETALENLSKNNLISMEKIREINKNKLAKLIRSAGYYNQKAERLKIMAGFLSENPIEKLDRLPISELRKKLVEIKGVGPETADSIILYAFGKPIFVVDAYTKRIFERLSYKEKTYNDLWGWSAFAFYPVYLSSY